MTEDQQPQVLTASFNPLIRPYLVLYVGGILVATIILIPLAVVWFCGVGQWWARHYFEKLQCELGPRVLRFRTGILVQTERTIPLENIQDVTFIEGPILKRFNLSVLKFETAGQSQHQAHAMQLIGIVDALSFRRHILERREAARQHLPSAGETTTSALANEQLALLSSMNARLEEIAALLRESR